MGVINEGKLMLSIMLLHHFGGPIKAEFFHKKHIGATKRYGRVFKFHSYTAFYREKPFTVRIDMMSAEMGMYVMK